LGIRKLVKNYFEMRVGLKLRLVFKVEPEAIVFAFGVIHDEVRRFLKQLCSNDSGARVRHPSQLRLSEQITQRRKEWP
jgi:hypothetical protein